MYQIFPIIKRLPNLTGPATFRQPSVRPPELVRLLAQGDTRWVLGVKQATWRKRKKKNGQTNKNKNYLVVVFLTWIFVGVVGDYFLSSKNGKYINHERSPCFSVFVARSYHLKRIYKVLRCRTSA